jgi:hypothetical protein
MLLVLVDGALVAAGFTLGTYAVLRGLRGPWRAAAACYFLAVLGAQLRHWGVDPFAVLGLAVLTSGWFIGRLLRGYRDVDRTIMWTVVIAALFAIAVDVFIDQPILAAAAFSAAVPLTIIAAWPDVFAKRRRPKVSSRA